MWVSLVGSHQGRFTMDIITNGSRLWRLVGLHASLMLQIIIVLYGSLHIDSSLAAASSSMLTDDKTELGNQTDSNYDKDDEWDTDFFKHSNQVEIDHNKRQIIEISHQTLDLHYLDKHSSSHKQRHLMAVALAGLAYEVATIATDAAVTLENLATLLVGLKSLQSHTCNNSDNAYDFNQKQKEDVCKSVSGKSINIREDIIEPYTTVAKLFHEDSSSKLRMIESDHKIYIYLPDGNNIALPRDTIESEYNLLQKYNKFKEYFTKTADFECMVEGRQCGVFTYNTETLNEAYKKVYQLIKDIQSDSKIVMYHKDSLICDAPIEVRRQLMQSSAKKPPRQKWIKEAAPKGNANKSHETRIRWCEDDEDEDEEYTVFGVSKADAQEKKDECLKKNQNQSLADAIDELKLDDSESCFHLGSYQSNNEKTEDLVNGTKIKSPQKQPCLSMLSPKVTVENDDCSISDYFDSKSNEFRPKILNTTNSKDTIIDIKEKQKDTKQGCCYDTGPGCSVQ
jgi:hypothetical protein